MNKIILIALFFWGFVFKVEAQLSVGVKSGLNLSNVNPGDYGESLNNSTLRSFHLGLYGVKELGGRFSLNPEISYSKKGYKNSGKTSASYLVVPILLGYDLGKKIQFILGPEFGYLLSTSWKTNDGQTLGFSIFEKKIDLGLDIGFRFNVGQKFLVDTRYNLGLLPLDEITLTSQTGTKTGTSNYGVKNKVVQLSLGFKLF